MGAFLEKPNTEKSYQSGSLEGDLKFAVGAMQGWRVQMEDAHTSVAGIPDHSKWSFFGVFDGHAGSKCASYTSEHLLRHILSNVDGRNLDSLKEGIVAAFLNLDEEIINKHENSGTSGPVRDLSGTTAITCLVTEDHIIFANCGDSRGLLCRRGEVVFATVDHKPYLQQERERIEKAGGNVVLQRINGSLAVSRALGDVAYKRPKERPATEQIVSPEPDVDAMRREEGDEFIVLACDGIWDVMDNDAVTAYVRRKLRTVGSLETIARDLIDLCLYKGSRDNISVVIVTFKDAPTVSDDALKEESANTKEAERQIDEKVKEIVRTNDIDKLDEYSVMTQLVKDLSENLDISSRWNFVVETLEKYKSAKPQSKGFFGRKK
jgi:serine/threonine protein phosphatase PrpC